MKHLCCALTLALILFASQFAFAGNNEARVKDLFSQAAEAYKKGDYENAIRLNKEALATGRESAAIHYNLANSYLKSRLIGRAIASYLRAERLSPGDVDVAANLNYARSMVALPASPEDRPFWVVPLLRFSSDGLRWGALFVFMLTASLALAARYAGLKRRKIVVWIVAGCGVFIYLVIGAGYRFAETSGLGVSVERADVKFEPSQQATTYYKLPEGAEIKVLREKDDWFKIERADHKAGWVPAKAVERI